MKFRVECSVEGQVLLDEIVHFSMGTYEYDFAPVDGYLRRFTLTAPVDRPELFRSTIMPMADDESELNINVDRDLYAAMKAHIQALESHIAFRLPVSRIRWDSPKYSLIFESDEERATAGVYEFHIDQANPILRSRRATRRDFGISITACKRFARLTGPFSFLREGENEFDYLRFINAFYNFYFVLEGLYGAGKWRNYQVVESFVAAPSFCHAVQTADSETRSINRRMYDRILAELNTDDHPLDPKVVAGYLVAVRGRLHHFSNTDREDEPTPFSHDKFQPAAYLARLVAIFALSEEMQKST